MDAGVVTAIITAGAALAVAVFGYWSNRKLGLPSGAQATIREEGQEYQTSLERKVSRLEGELATEQQARKDDKIECLAQIQRLTDDLIDKQRLVDRLMERMDALEGNAT